MTATGKRLLGVLGIEDIRAFIEDEDTPWGGYGYPNALANASLVTHPERITAANDALLARGNSLGWTRERLWTFLNSKDGRWFGEDAGNVSGYLYDAEGHTARCCAAAIDAKGEYHWAPGRCIARGQHRP